MTLLALLQARTSSTRLPGKVMKPILGVPMILRHIERLKRARLLEHLMVVTSGDASDDALAALCASGGIPCFRGSLDDVLDRFYQAARPLAPDTVVRLTGDCPLADPEVVDGTIAFFREGGYDYVSNALHPTFPDGLDVEVMRFSCLEAAWRDARLKSEREHVTPYVYNHPEHFRIGHYKQATDLSRLRWTVDQPEDFVLVEGIYSALYPQKQDFSTADILALLEQRRELAEVNASVQRNEGFFKSLGEDAVTLGGEQQPEDRHE